MAVKFAIEATVRAIDKVSRPMRRMTRTVDRASKAIGRNLMKLTKLTGKFARGMLRASAATAKFGVGGAGAFGAATVLLNKTTLRADQLSRALNVNVDLLEGIAGRIKPAGFELDNVVDLIEEMNNKLGESAGLEQTLPVQESLAILGLRFEKLRKLKPEEQFKRIADAIINLDDHAKAVSAADILFGGEANKIFGVLRDTGEEIDDIISGYRALNFQTDKSRQGAERFTRQFNRVTTTVATLTRFVAGLVGDALTPLLKKLESWILANKELIQVKVIDFVGRLPGLIDKITESTTKSIDALKLYGPEFADMTKAAAKFFRFMIKTAEAVERIFKTVGTFIGETAAKTTLFLDDVFDDRDGGGNVRQSRRELMRQAARERIPSGFLSSPQERIARSLEEKKVTNTTHVVLEDITGRARVTRGRGNRGFEMMQTGAN